MNTIIGVVGKPRSGKDSVGEILRDEYGFYVYSFADYLKSIANEYFGFDRDVLWGEKTRESRKFLQDLGKFLTDLDSNILIDIVVSKIKSDYDKCEKEGKEFNVVLTDIRRDEELDLLNTESTHFLVLNQIQDTGVSLKSAFDKYCTVLVGRDMKNIKTNEDGFEESLKHEIESLPDRIDNWNYYIDNNGTKEELRKNISEMLTYIEEYTDD